MFQRLWRFVDIHGVLCYPFPEDGPFSFQQPTMLGECRSWFPFLALESQPSIAIDRVDLFGIAAFDAHYVALVETCYLLIDLIFHPSYPFTRQVMILPSGASWAKRDPIEPLPIIGHSLTRFVG